MMARLLDYLELILLSFFVLMDSVALILLIPGKTWSQITVLLTAILLTVVLLIKFILKCIEKPATKQ